MRSPSDHVRLRFCSADSAILAWTSLDRMSARSKHDEFLTFLWVGALSMIAKRSSRFVMLSPQSNGLMTS
jgi:hypothetical protein